MAKQVQIRRDTFSNLAATVPAQGELGVDTTNKRVIAGDGSTSGGIPHVNYVDHQNNTFTYAAAGGTGNALTLTLAKAPAAYAAGQVFPFKATANNSGAATLNVNGLGTKNIYILKNGVIGAVVSGDIISGGCYFAFYDGTQFLIIGLAGGGITTVSQGDLNTSSGTFSSKATTTLTGSFRHLGTMVTLPGGQYGFAIETSEDTTSGSARSGFWSGNDGTSYAARVTPWSYSTITDPTSQGRQRYINSSPPIDMGDGDVNGFMFALLDGAGKPQATYFADVPPWLYNGPTYCRADYITPQGKKQRRVQRRSFEELMQGADPHYEMEEITQAIKNADMGLIPHPFGEVPAGHTVVLLDPMDDRIGRMLAAQNCPGCDGFAAGEEILKKLLAGDIYADNTVLDKRAGPAGVLQVPLRYKYTRKV